MRLAKSFGTVVGLLALLAWGASHLRAQAPPPAKASQTSKQPDKKPEKTPAASKPAVPAQAKAQPPAKVPADKQPAKKPAKTKSAKPQPATGAQPRVARRDPFDPLVGKDRPGSGSPERLPPGKAGLVVSTLRLDGIVRGPNGMIAVVSNPQQRVYFLREGDQLYDGKVERITMEGVAFHEIGKDAFGKPVDRQVTKRLYPSPGELQ
jgi:type IV pilus assembly protein PilP